VIERPQPSEYHEFYGTYVDAVPEGDVLEILTHAVDELPRLVSDLAEEQAGFRYEPGKWSVKEVVGHVADCELIFAYRMLRFARGDETALPGMDQDPYVENANFDGQPIAKLAEQFRRARQTTVALVTSFEGNVFDRRGIASENAISVRALAYILAGHELHHRSVLKERYGLS